MNKTFTVIIVGLLILAAAIYFIQAGDEMVMDAESEDTMQMEQEDTATDENTVDATADVEGSTQTVPANAVMLAAAETGLFATVASAKLSEPGFIVIYRVNSQNDTQVIGSTDLLEADTYTNISIQLEAPIASDQTIVAVLHSDDGDGEFDEMGSDGYMSDANQSIYSDVDVVDVDAAEESAVLNANVEAFLMENEGEMDV